MWQNRAKHGIFQQNHNLKVKSLEIHATMKFVQCKADFHNIENVVEIYTKQQALHGKVFIIKLKAFNDGLFIIPSMYTLCVFFCSHAMNNNDFG